MKAAPPPTAQNRPPPGLLPLALAPLLLLGACRPAPAPPETPLRVRCQAAEPADRTRLRSRAEYVGILRGDRELDLGFRVGGILDRIGPEGDPEGWREGTTLTAGTLLARLQQTDFESAVQDAQAKLSLAETVFERTEKLLADRTVSPQELDVARANRDSARASLERARQALEDSRITAPFTGTVVARLANAGEALLPGRTVLRFADLQVLSLELGVPDTLVGQVRRGREARVLVSAYEGRLFPGTVSEVGVAAKEGTRLFKVVVKIRNEDPDRVLRAGMSATVDFGGREPAPAGAVLVPLSALVGANGTLGSNRLAVFVVEPDGRARERPVETGDLVRTSVVVTRGLQPGERVVTFGAANLHDGAPVSVLEEPSPAGPHP